MSSSVEFGSQDEATKTPTYPVIAISTLCYRPR